MFYADVSAVGVMALKLIDVTKFWDDYPLTFEQIGATCRKFKTPWAFSNWLKSDFLLLQELALDRKVLIQYMAYIFALYLFLDFIRL